MQKKLIKNQLIWVERSEPAKGQPVMTVADEYKNVIATVQRTFNREAKRFEYQVFDHAGQPMFTETNRGRLKQTLLKDKEQLLKSAHERRLEAIKSKADRTEKSPEQPKSVERQEELGKLRQDQETPKLDQGDPQIEH